jgi:hypothetical protein
MLFAMNRALLAVLALAQTGCIVIGYRSGAGWSIWPGGLMLVVMAVIFLLFLFRRG